MFSTLKARLLCGLSVAGFAMSLTTGSAVPVQAATIDFNTRGELANNFIQGSQFSNSTNFYRQSKTGGITGGSVTGFSGPDYDATAVYQPLPQSFSSIGTTISLSMDFYFNDVFKPLAPGANAVRSFRLGLVDSGNGTFEKFGDPSLYVQGVYSLSLDQIALQPDQWLQLSANFKKVGAEDYNISTSLYDLGSDGLAPPTLLGLGNYFANGVGDPTLTAGSNTFSNPDIANPTYVGFSVLADGGIAKGDNLVVPGTVPEKPTWTLMLLGFSGLAFAGYRRAKAGHAIFSRA